MTKQPERESWQNRFDERFVKIGDKGIVQIPPEIVKSFIHSELEAVRREEKERVVKMIERVKHYTDFNTMVGVCSCGEVNCKINAALDSLLSKLKGDKNPCKVKRYLIK